MIHRSNQFNLTTRRHSTADVLGMLESEDWLTRTVSLRDRFGDNGLISVLIARKLGTTLDIDTWLMSCRVLKRGVEQFLLNHVYELARQLGLARIRGEYVPTAKNALVRDHYASLGFTRVQEDSDGRTVWELPVDDTWAPHPSFIRETPSDGLDSH